MFKISTVLIGVLLLFALAAEAKDVSVRGYYRKDGTYVQPHMRSSPNGNFYDNWSTKGNINPYTGAPGTKDYPGYNMTPSPSYYPSGQSFLPYPSGYNTAGSLPINNSPVPSSATNFNSTLSISMVNPPSLISPELDGYLRRLRTKLEESWNPKTIQHYSKVKIAFEINEKGELTSANIEESSGTKWFDKLALESVDSTLPLPGTPQRMSLIATFNTSHLDPRKRLNYLPQSSSAKNAPQWTPQNFSMPTGYPYASLPPFLIPAKKIYSSVDSNHYIRQNSDGKIIELDDGSIWEISSSNHYEVRSWSRMTDVKVIENDSVSYPYLIINFEDGEKAEAKLLKE